MRDANFSELRACEVHSLNLPRKRLDSPYLRLQVTTSGVAFASKPISPKGPCESRPLYAPPASASARRSPVGLLCLVQGRRRGPCTRHHEDKNVLILVH